MCEASHKKVSVLSLPATGHRTMVYRGPTSDSLQEAVGDFGRWQAGISFLMALLKLPIAWFQLSIIVLDAHTDFWCARPHNLYGNLTVEEWKNLSHPRMENVRQRVTFICSQFYWKNNILHENMFLKNKYSSKRGIAHDILVIVFVSFRHKERQTSRRTFLPQIL